MSGPAQARPGLTVASVSLNALKAFEAAARHLSFTKAGQELAVTQAAISHQVKALEERLGAPLFRRTARGLILTDEGLALLPTLTDTFDRLGRLLYQFEGGNVRETLTVSAVGTFAVWLIARLGDFRERYPHIDLRLLTNNNRVDLAGESLDYAIRFGDGAWHGTYAEKVMGAPFAPLCSPETARSMVRPADLSARTLFRSYRQADWSAWFDLAGVRNVIARGPQFDSSCAMTQAAMQSDGIALVPVVMFDPDIVAGRLVQPFDQEVDLGAYWLTRLKSREPSSAMLAFRDWVFERTAPGTLFSKPLVAA